MSSSTHTIIDNSLVRRYGLHEAIVLGYFIGWIRKNRDDNNAGSFHDGHWWMYHSLADIAAEIDWLSTHQIKRIARSLRSQGAIITMQCFKDQWDSRNHYAIVDEGLLGPAPKNTSERGVRLGAKLHPQCVQNRPTGGCNSLPLLKEQGIKQDTKVIQREIYKEKEISEESKTPETEPETKPTRSTSKVKEMLATLNPLQQKLFTKLWSTHKTLKPDNPIGAMKAIKAIKLDDDLIDKVVAKHAAKTQEWRDNQNGRFTPHLQTWLNRAEWEDLELPIGTEQELMVPVKKKPIWIQLTRLDKMSKGLDIGLDWWEDALNPGKYKSREVTDPLERFYAQVS